ncbi:TPA: hypothetical protein ACMDXH_000748 [Vibrio parahaemolyticus]|nr:hypothetical protein [Vibrio parahaemolyticus]EHY8553052.1 hypothetical protein [Vibrio parahaemolyticus]EIA9327232.1 hypothetical protein [Vibrio parahaemolyticus]EJV9414074.1 hypothetical protein [Vibrio vulnificus]
MMDEILIIEFQPKGNNVECINGGRIRVSQWGESDIMHQYDWVDMIQLGHLLVARVGYYSFMVKITNYTYGIHDAKYSIQVFSENTSDYHSANMLSDVIEFKELDDYYQPETHTYKFKYVGGWHDLKEYKGRKRVFKSRQYTWHESDVSSGDFIGGGVFERKTVSTIKSFMKEPMFEV